MQGTSDAAARTSVAWSTSQKDKVYGPLHAAMLKQATQSRKRGVGFLSEGVSLMSFALREKAQPPPPELRPPT